MVSSTIIIMLEIIAKAIAKLHATLYNADQKRTRAPPGQMSTIKMIKNRPVWFGGLPPPDRVASAREAAHFQAARCSSSVDCVVCFYPKAIPDTFI